MNLTRIQIIIVAAAGLVLLFLILGLLGVIPIFKDSPNNISQNLSLTVWGVDNEENFRDVISSYTQNHPGTAIKYQQIDPGKYEDILLNAFATNSGPDIFMFHRSWLSKHGNKIIPVSEESFSLLDLRQTFPDMVEKDFTYKNRIYALPLYLDSIALFYNKDIFNNKGVVLSPKTWDDFKLLVSHLTEKDFNNKITKSAAAIGTSQKSIDIGPDILSLLMLQFGSSIPTAETTRINLDDKAIQAANFYLQFSNSASPYYTWNDALGSDLNSFASGNTAMIFNYAKSISRLKAKNPYLNFSVSPAPQFSLSKAVNFSDYWGLSVSSQSKYPDSAWEFVKFTTTDAQTSLLYLKKTKLPPAHRILINQYQNDPELSVFARQTLTANSFYSFDADTFRKIFSDMIESILIGKLDVNRALEQAEAQLNQLY